MLFSVNYIYCNICRPAKRVEMKDEIFKSKLRCLQHSTSLVSALPEQISASSEKIATRGGRDPRRRSLYCQRLSLISNMASIVTNGSSTELEVRYSTKCRKYSICHCV